MSKGKVELPKSEWSFTPFKGLKDAIASNKYIYTKKDTIKEKTDEEIFQDAMSNVREIKKFRAIPVKRPPRVKQSHVQTDNSLEILRQIVNGDRKIRLSDTGEYIEWMMPDTRKDIVHRLHKGDFSVQDYIDLHGMTLSEAEEALCLFIKAAVKKGLFCVKVIHGRGLRSPGGPVLKEALKKWLQGTLKKRVLAYSTAKDCDGGLGATYIILKSR
jgi:DNA-nicking Smr family endonuclease